MQVTAKIQVLNLEGINNAIASKMNSAEFKSWIAPLEMNIDGNSLNVVAQNQFCVDYIKSVYSSVFNSVAEEFGLNINFSKKIAAKPVVSANDNKNQTFQLQTAPKPASVAFNKFVVCDENAFAFSAIKKLAAGGASFSPLFIYGPVGCGKTLLANCVNEDANGKTVFMTGATFVSEFVRAMKEGSVFAFKDFCRNCDTFILDNIQELAGKRKSCEEFLQLMLDLRERGTDILITSNTSPSNLSGFDKRLLSMLASGLTADIASPTMNVKKTMLVRSGVALNVAENLAQRLNGNGHLIAGVAKKINTYAELMGEKVTMQVAEKLLSDSLEKQKTPLASVQKMCEMLGVSFDEMCGKGRSKTLVRARQIMMFALKSGTTLSLSEIGRLCGDRDHATVLYAISQIKKLQTSDLIISAQISQMIEICR